MTLEEAIKKAEQLPGDRRTVVNYVGENVVIVKIRPANTEEKPYACYFEIKPKDPLAPTVGPLGEFSSLEEVKNHFIGLSFASGIDPKGWVVSPEKG